MPVYLDHAASWPIWPEAAYAMSQELGQLGNPASVHSFGQQAKKALETAREEIAKNIGCDRSEVILTSGGTESCNLAIKGLYWQRHALDPKRRVIVTAATEHHAVLDSIDFLVAEQGAEAVYLPVDGEGMVSLEALSELLDRRREEIAFISLMWANNETGVITSVAKVASLAQAFGIPVHSDAIAAIGHLPIDFKASGLNAMSITAHKVGGPVGIGALVLDRNTKVTSLLHGGDHELGRRAGTANVAGAIGFAKALAVTSALLNEMDSSHAQLAKQLQTGLSAIVPGAKFLSAQTPKLSGTIHVRFDDLLGETLMFLLDREGVAVSTGAACTAGVTGPSHVLLGMGATERQASSALRISLGPKTSAAEIDEFLGAFQRCYPLALRAGMASRA